MQSGEKTLKLLFAKKQDNIIGGGYLPPNFLYRFFFDTQGAKKKLSKKKRRFMGSAQTRKLLKNLDQNFAAWVQCVHWRLVGRTHYVI